MNLVDSCGWLEYFADGSNAHFFALPIENPKNLMVPVICIFEVFKRVLIQRGEDKALQAIALMHQGDVVELDATAALSAAKLSVHFSLPMADSIILAVAQANQAMLWTQDGDFEGIDGVNYIEK